MGIEGPRLPSVVMAVNLNQGYARLLGISRPGSLRALRSVVQIGLAQI